MCFFKAMFGVMELYFYCSNNLLILGANNSNVPRILAIIAEVCAEDTLQDDEQVYMRLLSIARHVQVGVLALNLLYMHSSN